MFRVLVLTTLFVAGATASAFNLTFDKALKAELDRCERVLITPYQKLVVEMLANAVAPRK